MELCWKLIRGTADKWKKAMVEEIQALKDNVTCGIVCVSWIQKCISSAILVMELAVWLIRLIQEVTCYIVFLLTGTILKNNNNLGCFEESVN